MDVSIEIKNPNHDLEEKMLVKENPIKIQTEPTRTTIPNTRAINNLSKALRSKSSCVKCPYCNHEAMTRTNTKCSSPNVTCSILCLGIGWVFLQLCRGKDLNCNDVTHYCIKCDANLANYNAC